VGNFRPFEINDAIVICSYQFARNKAKDVSETAWDLVVMDEAHRLRNVYKPSNVIANTLKLALASKRKLLLTATPLQNSLMELFGLVNCAQPMGYKGFQQTIRRRKSRGTHCNAPGKLLLGFACGPACQEPSGRSYGAWREHG
jgi:SNF2 family DNA or RNA helicase